MDGGARAARVEESHVHDGGVVVARVLSGREYGGEGVEASVGDLGRGGVASVDHPVEHGARIGVELQQQHDRLLSQGVDLDVAERSFKLLFQCCVSCVPGLMHLSTALHTQIAAEIRCEVYSCLLN